MDADRPQIPLRIEIEPGGNWTLMRLFGELDYSTEPKLRDYIDRLLEADQVRIAVDLSGLEGCDSVCMRCFVAAWKRTQEAGGALVLLRPREQAKRLTTRPTVDRFLDGVDALPDVGGDNGT